MFLSWVSLKKVSVAVHGELAEPLRIVYRVSAEGRSAYGGKTKDETYIRSRYVAETQTDKR
jgi:hypothetical protein